MVFLVWFWVMLFCGVVFLLFLFIVYSVLNGG